MNGVTQMTKGDKVAKMMDKNNDTELNADIEFVNQLFQEFLVEFTDSNNYLPEVTEPIIKGYGAKPKSVLAVMIYAFTAGLNTAGGLIDE